MINREAYVEKMKAKLDEWNASIARLEARAEGAGADMKEEINNEIGRIKKYRDEASSRIKDVQSAGDDAWEDFKTGIEKSWETLGEAFNSAMSRFK